MPKSVLLGLAIYWFGIGMFLAANPWAVWDITMIHLSAFAGVILMTVWEET